MVCEKKLEVYLESVRIASGPQRLAAGVPIAAFESSVRRLTGQHQLGALAAPPPPLSDRLLLLHWELDLHALNNLGSLCLSELGSLFGRAVDKASAARTGRGSKFTDSRSGIVGLACRARDAAALASRACRLRSRRACAYILLEDRRRRWVHVSMSYP